MKRSTAVSSPPRMTLEEWASLDEDEEGELVDGLDPRVRTLEILELGARGR